MNKEYYLNISGKQEGPFSIKQLQEKWLISDEVNPDTLFWQEGLEEWLPLSTIADLLERPGYNPNADGTQAAARKQKGYPVGVVCPNCGSDRFTECRLALVEFTKGRECIYCNTRYALPTPLWGAVVLITVGVLFVVFGIFLFGLFMWDWLRSSTQPFIPNHLFRFLGVGFTFAVGAAAVSKGREALKARKEG